MRLLWLGDVLRDARLAVFETPGWQGRGEDAMLPRAIVAHHTATRPGSDAALDRVLINGRPDLPGPLCHLHLTRQGQYRIIAAGVAHHAGSGGWKGLTGNRSVIGIEAANDGRGEPWPSVQLSAYDRGCAAILSHLGRDESWLCGHREWAPGRKIDPAGIDLHAMRARVRAIMDHPMTIIQARLEVATAWFVNAGEWMTPQPTESRQARLTRLAQEVLAKKRTPGQIAVHAVRVKSSDPMEPIPAWVYNAAIPFA